MKRIRIIPVIVFLLIGVMVSATAVAAKVNGSSRQSENQQKKEEAAKSVYSCPMHPEVVRDAPGKCPKCGMNLEKKELVKEEYTCPMHPEVIRDKTGKCPKCGCTLEKKEKKENKKM